jgi:ribonucleoside-diphosphate reductase alpha chain
VSLPSDYYRPEGFALEIFKKRYALHENETWEEACDRVARHVASAESGENVSRYQTLFLHQLVKNLFMPGGRIMYASGRPKGQLLNCFVVPVSDSREGWGKATSDMIVVTGTGGGLGINCSPIRPRGSLIHGTGGEATGAVSFMLVIDATGDVIKAGGGRRTALMLCLEADHGDVEEFISKKVDLNELTNANVSVVFMQDPQVFFDKVRSDEKWQLMFRGKVLKEISAKDLWEKIVRNALKNGEPGLLNGYLANKQSNIHNIAPLISTNPCGEIWLSAYDCCCLGSVVLPRFVHRTNFGESFIEWNQLKETVTLGVRFLDNVLTVNNYPLPEIKEVCSNIRRVGLGVMGLHDMLLLMGLKYNSDEGLELVNKVMNFIKNAAYEASIELAKEKGPFPKFEPKEFLKSGFVKTLKPSIRSKIAEHGIRNCALLNIPPTGTTSMVSGVTSGIEPMFAPAYLRRYRDGENLAEEVVVHPLLKRFIEEGRDTSHFQGTYEISMRDHFEMQRVCQRHLDNACSKTVNVPQGTSAEELSELYMEYFPELKGITVYPEGSRENQPLTPMSLEDAIKHVESAKLESYAKDSCKGGSCDL